MIRKIISFILFLTLIISVLMTAGCDNTATPPIEPNDTTPIANDMTTVPNEETTVEPKEKKLLENYDPNYKCDFTSDLGIQLAQTDYYKKAREGTYLLTMYLTPTPAEFYKDKGIDADNIVHNTGVRSMLVTDDSLYLMTYVTNKVLKEAPDYSLFSLIKYDNLPAELTQDLVKAKVDKNYKNLNGLINAISIIYTPEIIAESYVEASNIQMSFEGDGDNFSVKGQGLVVSDGNTKTIYIMGNDENKKSMITKSLSDLNEREQSAVIRFGDVFHVKQVTRGWAPQTNHEMIDTGLENGYDYFNKTNTYKEPFGELYNCS